MTDSYESLIIRRLRNFPTAEGRIVLISMTSTPSDVFSFVTWAVTVEDLTYWIKKIELFNANKGDDAPAYYTYGKAPCLWFDCCLDAIFPPHNTADTTELQDDLDYDEWAIVMPDLLDRYSDELAIKYVEGYTGTEVYATGLTITNMNGGCVVNTYDLALNELEACLAHLLEAKYNKKYINTWNEKKGREQRVVEIDPINSNNRS